MKSKLPSKSNLILAGIALLLAFAVTVLIFISSKYQHSSEIPAYKANQPEINFNITQPLPQKIQLNQDKVALGQKLFHDARLSKDNTISCASCHNLANGGSDNRARSIGVKGSVGTINSPTIFNSGFNFAQFWDGRAATLEDQVEGPIHHPKEMGSSWQQIIAKLKTDESYASAFNKLYEDGINPSNIKDAIATFDRSLITPNSRFDKFLQGDKNAINSMEKNGYALFQSYGCASCHQGINLGGNMYEKMGLMGDYFADRGNITEADRGRFNLNHAPESMYEFKVPGLRNVELTAPYFHDGNAKTLEQAIDIMAKYQLGRTIPQQDTEAIAAFLRTLTGEYQNKPL